MPVAEIAAATSDPNVPVPVPQEPTTTTTASIPVQPPQVPPGQPPAVVLAAQQQLMSSQQQHQDVEAGAIVPVTTTVKSSSGGCKRKRKTTQNDQSHGSFFLRIGAIAFGLGTMIYSGLEFGSWFEIPFTSQCYMILRGINPALQMVFTFMQMYFIFMNSRLNIHRFKVIARFGLMHVVATNICVWIRTLVLEYLKEITVYHKRMNDTYPERIRGHTLRNANTILGSHRPIPDYLHPTPDSTDLAVPTALYGLRDMVAITAKTFRNYVTPPTMPTIPTTTRRPYYPHQTTPPSTLWRSHRASPSPPALNNLIQPSTTTTTLPTTTLQTTTTTQGGRLWNALTSTMSSTTSSTSTTTAATTSTTTSTSTGLPPLVTSQRNFFANYPGPASLNANRFDAVTNTSTNAIFEEATTTLQTINGSELLDNILPQSLFGFSWNSTNEYPISNGTMIGASCDRINIMGTIVQDSAPYLFPFIIEYSLIGAAVIYVMWKHIGRNPRYISEEDLEHRLEVMLSRRAVAMAHAQQGRVDCVGASKGLFFGLLLLVGSLICLILFFVLIHHPDLGILAIYLADVSHCALMALSIIAIIVGFIRVQGLKFKVEEQSDLNDILLRVSAFGLFLYATFSVIAGSLEAFTKESNLLVTITGILSVVQVILQLLFIADVSRRRVHLPEHDRSKPGRQVVTFLLICNITMWIIYTFEMQKVEANPVQLEFYGFLAWAIVQRITLPLCIFHRFHSAVTLAEIWKTSYKARLE